MIVAPQPEAVEAGADMLRAGGNALDAVLAAAFTQGVVDPLMSGIGGLGSLQVYDPKSGKHVVFDGLSSCPAAARADMWQDIYRGECSDGFGFIVKGGINEAGRTAVTTPAIMRLFGQAHAEFGSQSWAKLPAAAIAHAEDGWVIRPHVYYMMATNELSVGRLPYIDKLNLTPDGKRLYMRADGTPKRVGEAVRNPELAATLKGLARDGAESFYTGEIAQRIVKDMEENSGLVTMADLKACKTRRTEPLKIAYRGRIIAVQPPPAGGIVVAELLRILERFDLVSLGHNSAEYIRVLAEAMKIAGRDKDEHIGDPDVVPPPLDRLLSDTYADDCAARIRRGDKAVLVRISGESKGTTTVSCIDAAGMVATLTHTLGTPSGVIPAGMGFMLNGAMNAYDPRPGRASSIGPGKRRFSSMSPTIVLDGGRPVMTVGAPGGAWIGVAIAQVLMNVLDWGMTIQEAVQAPRFSSTSETVDISNRIPRAVQRDVEKMGYKVKRSPMSYPFAAPHGITMFDGVLEGGADPQRDGYVQGIA